MENFVRVFENAENFIRVFEFGIGEIRKVGRGKIGKKISELSEFSELSAFSPWPKEHRIFNVSLI